MFGERGVGGDVSNAAGGLYRDMTVNLGLLGTAPPLLDRPPRLPEHVFYGGEEKGKSICGA